MIVVKNGSLVMSGTMPEMLFETTTILHKLYEQLVMSEGKEMADYAITECGKLALLKEQFDVAEIEDVCSEMK